MKLLSQLTKKHIRGKRCLVRASLDIHEAEKESLRIDTTVPTLRYLLDAGAEVTILSHRGRPKGVDETLSLKPFIHILEKKVGKSLNYLENLRFDPREQENSIEYGRELASQADFYVNNDFAVSHRNNASVVAITQFLPSYAGLQLEKEIKILTKVRDNPERPLVVIMGGIKIDDKVGVIAHLYHQAEHFLMGSAYLTIDLENNDKAKILRENKVMLPIDWETQSGNRCDIGPETIKQYKEYIAEAKTIIWNGSVGKVEDGRCLIGSTMIAHAIAESGAFSVVGGGDSEQFIRTLHLADRFSFISTGGGAMLSFLSGETLPAIEALECNTLMLS